MPDQTIFPDLVREIENQFEDLSPQLQIAARYIIDSPEDVAIYSMREIALRAHVKPATMVRLSAKFGYQSYNGFRNDFRMRVSSPASGYAARARQLQINRGRAETDELISDIYEAEKDNIHRTYGGISDEKLAAAAAACVNAQKIYVVGLRKCFPVAFFFHYATRVFFPGSMLIQGSAGLFREEIAAISDADVTIAIAFEPYTRETVETVNAAREAGGKIIVITDSVVSPLAKVADFVFLAANRSPSFYRSLSGALSISQLLVAAIVTHIGEDAIEALEKSDTNLRSNNTYWYN